MFVGWLNVTTAFRRFDIANRQRLLLSNILAVSTPLVKKRGDVPSFCPNGALGDD